MSAPKYIYSHLEVKIEGSTYHNCNNAGCDHPSATSTREQEYDLNGLKVIHHFRDADSNDCFSTRFKYGDSDAPSVSHASSELSFDVISDNIELQAVLYLSRLKDRRREQSFMVLSQMKEIDDSIKTRQDKWRQLIGDPPCVALPISTKSNREAAKACIEEIDDLLKQRAALEKKYERLNAMNAEVKKLAEDVPDIVIPPRPFDVE